jgi:amino acid transporter
MPSHDAPRGDAALIRALTVRSLGASVVNTTVGAGIFVLPAAVGAALGAAAPLAYLVCAGAMALIVASFAMAGSRVALTGGLYAYVEVAFGPYVGFLAGVLMWVGGVLSVSAVATAFASQVAELAPAAGTAEGRAVLLIVVFAALAAVNVRGVRHGARLVESMTLAKLLPLVVFVAVGVFFVDLGALAWPGWPASSDLGGTVLLLIFAFLGVEVALVPSGEVKDPARTVPRALFLALAATTLLYLAIQLVAQGVLGAAVAQFAAAPLAEAAGRFMGPLGRSLVLLGGTISMFGYLTGDMLGSPRALFAFGRDGILPAAFARVHASFHTPHVAIVAHAAIVAVVAISSTFEALAIIGNVAVLSLYLVCCVAALELRRRDVRAGGTPFVVPGARVVPVLASAAIVWILSHATRQEFVITAVVLVVASVLYWLRHLRRKRALRPAAEEA